MDKENGHKLSMAAQPRILALGRLRQKDCKSEDRLAYIVGPYLEIKRNKKKVAYINNGILFSHIKKTDTCYNIYKQ
jgi:hypothetical protein